MNRIPTPIDDAEIDALLADPQYHDHPLRDALERLHGVHREQLDRLERLTRISDGFQTIAHTNAQSLSDRYSKQLRQLEKLARISDRYQQIMRELNQALEVASTHDALTGLPNRRALLTRLREECQRSLRQHQPLVIALADIDHFKGINDHHGHDVGDDVLISVADCMRDSVRPYDYCGRWGGEEFMILLGNTDVVDGEMVLDRLRERIATTPHASGARAIAASVSIGMTALRDGEAADAAIKRADDALLTAKRSGRNRRLTA